MKVMKELDRILFVIFCVTNNTMMCNDLGLMLFKNLLELLVKHCITLKNVWITV